MRRLPRDVALACEPPFPGTSASSRRRSCATRSRAQHRCGPPGRGHVRGSWSRLRRSAERLTPALHRLARVYAGSSQRPPAVPRGDRPRWSGCPLVPPVPPLIPVRISRVPVPELLEHTGRWLLIAPPSGRLGLRPESVSGISRATAWRDGDPASLRAAARRRLDVGP